MTIRLAGMVDVSRVLGRGALSGFLEETARFYQCRLVVLDMRAHEHLEYRETMGHLWPGFTEDETREWMEAAGLETYRHVPLAPDPSASGPMLFVGTAVKPAS